jgi:hypothetical protein
MARPDDWIDRTVIIGTDMYGGDTVGTLEEVNDRGVVVRHGIVEPMRPPRLLGGRCRTRFQRHQLAAEPIQPPRLSRWSQRPR